MKRIFFFLMFVSAMTLVFGQNKAQKFFEKHLSKAQNNNAKSMYWVGGCYAHGSGVKKDLNEAYKWYKKAAEHGNADGAFECGNFYYYGHFVSKDEDEAIKWYELAKKLGYKNSTGTRFFQLGNLYFSKALKYEEEKRYSEAALFYKKGVEFDDKKCEENLGILYCLGEGVEQNYAEGYKWLMKAKEHYSPSAGANIGKLYYNGLGVNQDYFEAVKYFKWSIGFNPPCSAGLYMLGICYYNGQGVEKNIEESKKLFTKAAENGNKWAAYQLGEMYRFGKDVVADSVLSLKWHTEAAKQGIPESQFVVGSYAYNAKNYSYAHELFTDAAKNGIKGAKGYLGIMYYYGLYVTKDYTQAFTLLKECAEAGEVPEVMRVLAACYRYGLGTTENIEQEKYWIKQAALHNDMKAQKIISYTGL